MRRLIVATAILALAVGAYWFTTQRKEQRERAARREATLLVFDDRAVEAIDLTVGGDLYRLELRPDGWWIASPFTDRADGAIVSELMSLTRRSLVTLRIAEPEPLPSYGLAPPNISVRYDGVDAPVLDLGAVSPDNRGVYGRLGDSDEVLLIETVPGSLLTQIDIDRFRDPAVLGVSRPSIREVTVERQGAAPIRIERDGGAWWTREPVALPAADGAVTAVLELLENAEIARFIDGVDPEDPAFGLTAPAVVLRVRSEEGDRVLRIGAPTGIGDERYVTTEGRPPILAVRGLAPGDLPAEAEALGDTQLTKVNRYRVRSFTYRSGDRSASFERSEDGWTSDGEPVEEEDAFAILVRTLQAPVARWSAASAPAGEPDAELDWTLEDGERGRLRFWGRSAISDAVPEAIATLRADPPPVAE